MKTRRVSPPWPVEDQGAYFDEFRSRVETAVPGSVDVVIPVRDGAKTILGALNSVFSQTILPQRIIVVDDGSTDATADIVANIGSDLIHLITTKPSSISHARNRGIAASQAEFVAFLDADDCWRREKLQLQLQVFSRNKNAVVVYSGCTLMRPSGAVVDIVRPALSGFVLQGLLSGGHAGHPSSVVVRREALLHIGGFDQTILFGQDTDLLLRLARFYEFDFVTDPLVDVIQNPDSITRRYAGYANRTRGDIQMDILVTRISVYEKWCGETKISWKVAQAFRKQIVAAAVRCRYGLPWMIECNRQLQRRSPKMARRVWRNHTTFAAWIALAISIYPIQLLIRKTKVLLMLAGLRADSVR